MMKEKATPKLVGTPVGRIVSYYARPAAARTGGVSTSRQQWMAGLADAGFDVLIVNATNGLTERRESRPNLKFREVRHIGRGRMTMLPVGLRKVLRPGDLVYLHEGWTPSNVAVAAYCKRAGIPYVVLPHGVYEPQIVRTLKPFPGRTRVERWVLENALAVHLFFESERSDLALLAPRAKTAVAMTGMMVPEDAWSLDDADDYVAWVGRYDVLHKGIDVLFAALAELPPETRPVVRMHGPDYFGGKQETEALREAYGLTQSVQIGGELSPDEVARLIRRSRAFVHVPRWEAFGRTILENLAVGVPVILGDGARIAPTLGSAGAARIVSSASAHSIAEGLRDLPSEAVGHAGRQWALDNATWDASVQAILSELRIHPS